MDLINFIEISAGKNDRLGELSRYILLDVDLLNEKSDKEMFEYLDFKMISPPNSEIYLELKRAYLKFKYEIKKTELEKINPILKNTFQPLFDKGFISKEEFDKIMTSEISSPDTYLVNILGQSRTNEIETAMKLDYLKSK